MKRKDKFCLTSVHHCSSNIPLDSRTGRSTWNRYLGNSLLMGNTHHCSTCFPRNRSGPEMTGGVNFLCISQKKKKMIVCPLFKAASENGSLLRLRRPGRWQGDWRYFTRAWAAAILYWEVSVGCRGVISPVVFQPLWPFSHRHLKFVLHIHTMSSSLP